MLSLSAHKNTLLDFLFLIPLGLFFLLFGLGGGSLASWDEAIYAAVAREIALSGHWFRLTLSGEPWFDKPPLAIWMTALFFKLFGIHEFTARLFSALCGAGTLWVTYLMGRQLFNRWTGFLGALVLLSSSHFLRFARFGMLDAPLMFFMTAAFYFFWLGHFKNRYLIFSGIAIGLAVMTKGFAAFLIFPVIWVYCFTAGRASILTRSSYWIGVMVAVAIALPWHLSQLFLNQTSFMEDVMWRHLVSRTFSSLDGHVGSMYFYLRVLVNKFHPWILIGLFSAPFFLFRAVKDRDDESIFLSSWMFVIFTVFTLVRTKLAWYILPVYPALSLTVAYVLAQVFRERSAVYVRVMFVVIMALHVPYSHIFDHDYSRDIKGIAPAVNEKVPPDGKLALYRYHESPAVSFYTGRVSTYLETKEELLKRAQEPGFYCLIHDKDLDTFTPNFLAKSALEVRASVEGIRLLAKKS